MKKIIRVVVMAIAVIIAVAVAIFLSENIVEIAFLIFGVVLLGVSVWGWIGFVLTVKMRKSFNITTPSEFLSMSIMGVGFMLIYWLWWLGLVLVFLGIISSFILRRILSSIIKRRYLPDIEKR